MGLPKKQGGTAMRDRLRSVASLGIFMVTWDARMERPIGKRGQWEGIRSLDSGDFGVGEGVQNPIFRRLADGFQTPIL